MKRHSFRASLALAALAVTSIAGPLVAAEQVPFKGTLEGYCYRHSGAWKSSDDC